MKALSILFVPWLRCTGAVSLIDRSSLLAHDLDTVPAAASGKILPLDPSQALAELVHRAVTRAADILQDFETKMEEERKEVVSLKEYSQQVEKNYGVKGSLFGEVKGFMPVGQMDEGDKKMATKLLGLLKDEAFAKALKHGMTSAGKSLQTYFTRTQKAMADVRKRSANMTESQLAAQINSFFEMQQHVIGNIVDKVQDDLMKALLAAPDEYRYLAGFAGPLMKQFANTTNDRVALHVQRIIASNGTVFCDEVDDMLSKQVLPLMNDTVSAVPTLELHAKAIMPEVLPEVQRISKQVSEIFSSILTSLTKEGAKWSEQLCSLVVTVSEG